VWLLVPVVALVAVVETGQEQMRGGLAGARSLVEELLLLFQKESLHGFQGKEEFREQAQGKIPVQGRLREQGAVRAKWLGKALVQN